ncbi:MAG: hypothetical protein QOJ07_337 [Thermoleophilaceae bacterium]|nr:hypothetical protein [Thermoleophilaceae bacterium]
MLPTAPGTQPNPAPPPVAETVEISRLPQAAYVWKVVDGALRLVESNDAGRIVEPAVDEMLAMSVDGLRERVPEIADGVLRALDQQCAVSAESTYLRSDGEERLLSAVCVYAAPASVIAYVDDVTERRGDARLLESANRRFRDAFHGAAGAKAIVGVEGARAGRLLEVNDTFCELFGYTREVLLGGAAPDLGHPDDPHAGLKAVAGLLTPGDTRASHVEKRFVAGDGQVLTIDLWVALVQDDNGGPCALADFIDVTQREEAEAAIRASEQRYRQIVETMREGVWLIDSESRTAFVNERMAEMLGYGVDEMVGRPIASLVDGAWIKVRSDPGRTGEASQHEATLLHRDGSSVQVSISDDPLPTDEGKCTGAMAIVTNMTERRRADADLVEAQAQFESAFDDAPIGIALVSLAEDDFGAVLRVNSALCTLLGYSEPELKQLTFHDLRHPDDAVADDAYARQLMGSELDSWAMDRRYVHKDGHTIVAAISASVVRRPAGQAAYSIAHLLDVTDIRRAAEQAQENDRTFRAVFDTALDAMLIADDDRTWVRGNPAAAELLGIDRAEIPGRRLDDFAPRGPFTTERGWRKFIAAGAIRGELELHRPDGQTRHLEFSARANCTPHRHLTVLRDVTERKRAEEKRALVAIETQGLQQTIHQAQRLETVGQLAGGVAHDFNNLLAVIMHASEFALSELEEGSVAEEVREIRKAADRAASLVRQLLVFSRQQIAEPEVLDLNGVVTGVEQLLHRTIGEHILMEHALDPDLPAVRVDPTQIEQVVVNLAVNGRDAMPGGGTLRIETSAVTIDDVYASRHADVSPGRYVRLAVTDDGHGMSSAVRQKAFEPFFTTKPPGAGTGLGLATTYGIVKQSGGHVEIYSEEGSGTVVKVYLPAAETGAGGREPAEPQETAAGGGERILLVEDEEGVRRLTERILTTHGYAVVSAEDVGDAVGLAADVDLVLTDVVMPGMSGAALVARLREDAPHLPAIFMSGYIERPDALPTDAPFIGKPFSRHALLDLVAATLRHRPAVA